VSVFELYVILWNFIIGLVERNNCAFFQLSNGVSFRAENINTRDRGAMDVAAALSVWL